MIGVPYGEPVEYGKKGMASGMFSSRHLSREDIWRHLLDRSGIGIGRDYKLEDLK